MNIWSAPDIRYLLDDHLKQARLELLSDSRLKLKAEDDGGEDPGFVAELIVDKLEAAAQAGFDAIEASLRASASEHLAARGLGVLQVRAALANACERLVPPKRPQLEKVEIGGVPAAFIAGMLSAAGIILAFMLHQLGDVDMVGQFGIIAGSIVAGYAVYRWRRAAVARRRVQLIEEWPIRVVRHYGSTLSDATAYYEHVVRTAARGGTLIPWR